MTIALSVLTVDTAADIAGSDARGDDAVLMAIITDLTYRKAAEATRTRLLERLISAEDEERRRIARELHDEAGQSLTAIMVGLRAIADMRLSAGARTAVLHLRDVAMQTVDDIGRLARGLHPAILDDKGLAAAATRYVADFARAFGVAVEVTMGRLDSPRLAPLTAATMYRILQECLTNVARHAHAKRAVVELRRDRTASSWWCGTTALDSRRVARAMVHSACAACESVSPSRMGRSRSSRAPDTVPWSACASRSTARSCAGNGRTWRRARRR